MLGKLLKRVSGSKPDAAPAPGFEASERCRHALVVAQRGERPRQRGSPRLDR
jgi:hypothetical protein